MKKISAFRQKVYKFTQLIPKGRVSTYKELALAIGDKNLARAVGNALNANPFAPTVPCHRVVSSRGTIGGYAYGENKKRVILKKEGVTCQEGRIKDFSTKVYKF